MSPLEIRHATRQDLIPLVDVLAAAFADDPVLNWLLGSRRGRRDQRLGAFFATELRTYFRHGKPIHIVGDGRSAAMWAPPGAWAPTTQDSVRELLPMLAVFRTGIFRAARVGQQLSAAHASLDKHWYLYMLGTHPESQGRGIGSALLRAGLARVDAAGGAAYLESSNVRNLTLYQRHGFRVIEEVTLTGGGPTLWLMWRDPVGTAQDPAVI